MAARRKRLVEEEHENHERWLITYADMITLLMAFFIMLFAMSQVDLAKFKEFSGGLQTHYTGGAQEMNLATEGGQGVLDGGSGMSQTELLTAAEQVLDKQAQEELARELERDRLGHVEEVVTRRAREAGLTGKVDFRLEARGLVVTIVSDDVMFPLGSADLEPQGRAVLRGLAGVLRRMPNHIAIEGHTDNVPVSGGPYGDNWVLSTARATSVLQHLLSVDVPASRLSAAGYADQRPLEPNTTSSNRAANRRVEIVILATTAPKEGT